MNKVAEVFPSQSTTVQEDGAASSTDVIEPVADSTEVCKILKEFVSVEQVQRRRAGRTRSMCIESENTATEILSSSHTLTAGCEWRDR